MTQERKQILLDIAAQLRTMFESMETNEVVAVLNKALCDNSKHIVAPYSMIWNVAEECDAQKVVIKKGKDGKLNVEFCAKRGGQLRLEKGGVQ